MIETIDDFGKAAFFGGLAATAIKLAIARHTAPVPEGGYDGGTMYIWFRNLPYHESTLAAWRRCWSQSPAIFFIRWMWQFVPLLFPMLPEQNALALLSGWCLIHGATSLVPEGIALLGFILSWPRIDEWEK